MESNHQIKLDYHQQNNDNSTTTTTTTNNNNNNHQQQQQNPLQIKCELLEYHIQEAQLVNKALRSELKQYRDKVEFEKKLRKFLINKLSSGVNSSNSSSTTTTTATATTTTFNGHSDRIWTLAWNPTGTVLASSGGDKRIRLWAKEANDQWSCVAILDDTHEKSIRRLSWSPCGLYIASASFDSTISVWKQNETTKTWKNIHNLEGHSSEVKSVAWSHDGHFLATCGRDKSVWIWERATSNPDGDVDDEEDDRSWDCSDVKSDHNKDVKNIVWHPTVNILLSCSYDDTAKLFYKEGDDWKCYQTLSSHSSTVWSADFSGSGEFLVTCSDDKTIRIWKNNAHDKLPDIVQNSWKCVSVIQGYHNRSIFDVSWNKLNDTIVSASGDNSLIFYAKSKDALSDPSQDDLFTCLEKQADAHDSDVNVVAWRPKDSCLMASASDDRTIKIWHYDIPEKGRMQKPMTVVDQIIKDLNEAGFNNDSNEQQHTNNKEQSHQSMTKLITDFSTLSTLIDSLQNLQNEINTKSETIQSLEQIFDLKLSDIYNREPVEIGNLLIDENNFVQEFRIKAINSRTNLNHEFIFKFDKKIFKLSIPRRTTKLLVLNGYLFLLEKTGDMFKISPDGNSEFLLGHLFTFADVKFLSFNDVLQKNTAIKFILSADRDEKIRITNFPNTHDIERFCFGHKSFVDRLYVVSDNKRFISVDQDNNAILWDVSNLNRPKENNESNQPILPFMQKCLVKNPNKRIKV